MSHQSASTPASQPPAPAEHPYVAEIDLEHTRWSQLAGLCRSLGPVEREAPGYYRDPDWSVKDLVAHVGTWLALAGIALEQIGAGTYADTPFEIEAVNARALAALQDQPWDIVWTQAQAARTMMLRNWYGLAVRTPAADGWVAKAGADHYGEHLPRLEEWVIELHAGGRAEAKG